MKPNVVHIFIDDGYPEASEYDNNFVSYHPAISGSYEEAIADAGLGPWRPAPSPPNTLSAGVRGAWHRLIAALM